MQHFVHSNLYLCPQVVEVLQWCGVSAQVMPEPLVPEPGWTAAPSARVQETVRTGEVCKRVGETGGAREMYETAG